MGACGLLLKISLLPSSVPWLCYADVTQSSQPDLDPAASDSEVDVIGATAQCVYLLYGLEVSERNEAFTDGFQVGSFLQISCASAGVSLCSIMTCI